MRFAIWYIFGWIDMWRILCELLWNIFVGVAEWSCPPEFPSGEHQQLDNPMFFLVIIIIIIVIFVFTITTIVIIIIIKRILTISIMIIREVSKKIKGPFSSNLLLRPRRNTKNANTQKYKNTNGQPGWPVSSHTHWPHLPSFPGFFLASTLPPHPQIYVHIYNFSVKIYKYSSDEWQLDIKFTHIQKDRSMSKYTNIHQTPKKYTKNSHKCTDFTSPGPFHRILQLVNKYICEIKLIVSCSVSLAFMPIYITISTGA